MESLLSVLHSVALRSPNSEFLVEDVGASLTYRQFYLFASQILPPQWRCLYPPLATPRRRRVILISPNNSLLPLALWSFWFMSIAVVPISINANQALWGDMVNLANPDVLIISRSLKDVAAMHLNLTADMDVVYLEDIIPVEFTLSVAATRQSDFIPSLLNWFSHVTERGPSSNLDMGNSPAIDTSLPALALFTSSAVDTSSLKSVTYSHRVLFHSTANGVDMLLGGVNCSREPIRHLGWLPLSHVYELCFSLFGIVLQSGGSYIFFDRTVSSPQSALSTPLHSLLLQAVRYHHPIESFCSIPAIFADIMKDSTPDDTKNLKAMRFLCLGGAPTSEAAFQWAAEHGIAYFDCLGATEVAGAICIRRAMAHTMRDRGLTVVPGLEGFLEKESQEDNFGELILRGEFLPSGYDGKESNSFLRNQEDDRIIYRTGDIYEQDISMGSTQTSRNYVRGENLPEPHPGCFPLSGLKYLGRVDDQVVLASGVKIDALALEKTLNGHPLVVRSAVIPDVRKEEPVVLIQPSAPQDGLLEDRQYEELVRFTLNLNRSLSFDTHVRAENVVVVNKLPITTKLTLNRKEVKKVWVESGGSWPDTKKRLAINVSGNHRNGLNNQTSLRTETRGRINNILSDLFGLPVDQFSRQPSLFSEIPLTSMSSVRFARALELQFSCKLTASQLFSLRNVDDICNLVLGSNSVEASGSIAGSHQKGSSSSLGETVRVAGPSGDKEQSLVISGVACRYPGRIRSIEALWEALLDPQTYSIKVSKSVPPSRWSSEDTQNEDIPPIAWLEDEMFGDLNSFRDFFRLSPTDAENMSPNARLALQLGYQAIEDAAIAPGSLSGQAWGVFTSVNSSGWRERKIEELGLHRYSTTLVGSSDDAVGARLSYFLNLTGPAIEIKTACSSSAVAIHQACSSIRNGDCDAAIVLASTTHFHPSGPMFRSSAGMASKSGQCATFSDNADGFLPGEGAAAIIIQKACDDGRSHGFFAPNPEAQARLISQALNKGQCSENDVTFVETHGTGTQIGDALELRALEKVFGGKRSSPLRIGAAKAVLGHTEEVAGLTGVLKSLLCLQRSAIPAQHNCEFQSSQFDFAEANISVTRETTSLPRRDTPRIIGISSFGLSGTLAHIILEDSGDISSPSTCSCPKLFILSANNQASFMSLLERYLEFATSTSGLKAELSVICKSSQTSRDHLALRRAFPVDDHLTWTTAMFDELHSPNPRQNIRAGRIRIGIWFDLPVLVTSFKLFECPLITHETALVTRGNWDSRYAFFAQQLIIANVLKSLGCEISAVGGEGIAEWVAAVYTGALCVDSVFQKVASREGINTYVLRGSKEKVKELLTHWLPTELSLRGHLGNDSFILEGTAHAIEEFASLGGFNIHINPSIQPAEAPRSITSRSTVPLFSGFLGDVLDYSTVSNPAYWSRVANDFVESSKAVEGLATHCDLVLHIGGHSLAFDDVNSYVHYASESFEHLLGKLYEAGCDLDWTQFGADGRMLHLPVYQW